MKRSNIAVRSTHARHRPTNRLPWRSSMALSRRLRRPRVPPQVHWPDASRSASLDEHQHHQESDAGPGRGRTDEHPGHAPLRGTMSTVLLNQQSGKPAARVIRVRKCASMRAAVLRLGAVARRLSRALLTAWVCLNAAPRPSPSSTSARLPTAVPWTLVCLEGP